MLLALLQQRRPVRLCRGGYEQISDADASVMAARREGLLDSEHPVSGFVRCVDPEHTLELRPVRAELFVVLRREENYPRYG